MLNYEIRDNKLHISGYVNAVERDSKVIMTRDGRCVEQIAAGAFSKSLADGHEVRMKLNHKRDIGSTADGTLELREDRIGLYAEAETEDEELRQLAADGKLTGWSFGFVKRDGVMEQRGKDVPRRRINALDLSEVSILSVTPAYDGTSVECRAEEIETRSYDDYESAENGAENGAQTDDSEIRGRVQYFLMKEKIKQLKGQQRVMEVRYLVEEAKRKQAEYEERYNPYHDPHNGQFTSAGGGSVVGDMGRMGYGLQSRKIKYVKQGEKGKGVIMKVMPNAYGGITFYDKDGKEFTELQAEDLFSDRNKFGFTYDELTGIKKSFSKAVRREEEKKNNGQQRVMEVRYLVEEAKRKQAEYEERYNPYHDPHNGQFTSGGGGFGSALFVEKGSKGYQNDVKDYGKSVALFASQNVELEVFDKEIERLKSKLPSIISVEETLKVQQTIKDLYKAKMLIKQRDPVRRSRYERQEKVRKANLLKEIDEYTRLTNSDTWGKTGRADGKNGRNQKQQRDVDKWVAAQMGHG